MLESGTTARGVAQSSTGRELALSQVAMTAFRLPASLTRTPDNNAHRQEQVQLARSQPLLVAGLIKEDVDKSATNSKEPNQP